MAITKDDDTVNDGQGDQSSRQEDDLMGKGQIAAITRSTTPNIPFTPQQKAFIMSLFGMDIPSAPNSDPVFP